MYSTREGIENWLNQMRIKNYVINEDLTVDVDGSVEINGKNLKEIPVKFSTVNGIFNCSRNLLISLKGCPEIVNSHFYCSENLLTNLEGCPQFIHGDFKCNNNQITNLNGCCKKIDGNFYCGFNKLTNLENCPQVSKGFINVDCNNLTSLKGLPNLITNSYLSFNSNNFLQEELGNIHFDVNNFSHIFSDFNINGNKEEFLNQVNYYKSKKENDLLKALRINSDNIKLNKKL